MHTKHPTVDDGAQCHEVKDLAASLPYRGISVLLKALLVETVDLSDLARLVVTTYQRNPIRIPNILLEQFTPTNEYNSLRLEAQQQREGLQTEVPSVHVVTEEYKVSIQCNLIRACAGRPSALAAIRARIVCKIIRVSRVSQFLA